MSTFDPGQNRLNRLLNWLTAFYQLTFILEANCFNLLTASTAIPHPRLPTYNLDIDMNWVVGLSKIVKALKVTVAS